MKRVLVTGATGFIGAGCVPRLVEAGFEVHAVAPESEARGQTDGAGVTWHAADLLETAGLDRLLADARPTHLLHLAWYVVPGDYWTSSENLRWQDAGLALAHAFAEAGGRRSVMAGTVAEYEWGSSDPLVPGVTPLRPATTYGAAKAGLHVASSEWFAEQGVGHAWAHVFYLYGPREHPARLAPGEINALLRGERWVCTHPDDIRDFVYVEDVARALVALLDSDVGGDVNIASGEPTRVGDLAAEIAEEIGRPDLVTYAEQRSPISVLVGDPTRLRREVGWTPAWDRRSAIHATVEWWRERGEPPV